MPYRTVVFAAMVALLPGAAGAQDGSPGAAVSLAELSRTAVVKPAPEPPRRRTPAPPPRRKDSLLNGILIGAGLGAIAGAAGGTAAIACDECAGFNVPLTFGVVGGAAGAAIGAGIDALFHARASDAAPEVRDSRTTPKRRQQARRVRPVCAS